MRSAFRVFLLSLPLLAVACDRTPTELPVAEQLRSSPVGARTAFAPSATSLASLFRGAVVQVEREQGAEAAREVLSIWHRLNEEAAQALKAGDRATAQARIAAVRAEEIRIVLQALGQPTAERVLGAVSLGFANARIGLGRAQSSGKDVGRGLAVAAQVSEALIRANGALQNRNYAATVDYTSQASDLLDALNRLLISLEAIPAVEAFFQTALHQLTREQGREAAATLTARWTQLQEQARTALRAGDRATVQARLEAARKEQIRIILLVLGTGVAQQTLEAVDAAIPVARERLGNADDPRLVQRGQTMLNQAASLSARARVARPSDPATALDLASHAAGLVNALHLLLPR